MSTVTFLCTLALFAQGRAQGIDQGTLIDIFGTPPPSASTLTPRLEDITVRPTDSSTLYTDENGDECKCVPYYLCDADLNAVDANNASATGWGRLDIRFGEGDKTRTCQESVERCCKNPKQPSSQPTSEPNSEVTTQPPVVIKGCGYRNPNGLDFTLTGGSGAEAGFGEYPWVVALLDAYNNSYVGVGVLIHPSVVMTGAHVIEKFSAGSLKARAGEWDTQTVKERLPHQERMVQDMIIHEGFRSKTLYNDIALLHLEQPMMLDLHINTICLPDQGENFDKSRSCVANGWGKDVFGGPGRYAVILKRVVVDMVPYNRCNYLLKRTRLGKRFNLHNSFVCAGGEEGKDTCQGDGGAPLACPVGNDRYKLTGLVAWGIGCGEKDIPAVYADVAKFRNWVDHKMSAWGYDTTSAQRQAPPAPIPDF